MDLSVHRAILWLALTRECPAYAEKAFLPLWLGNWLTDMNQATAFFALADGTYDSYDAVQPGGTYKLPAALQDNQELRGHWLNLYRALWEEEMNAIARIDQMKRAMAPGPLSPKVTSVNQIGAYFPYDHFDVTDRIVDGKTVNWEQEDIEKYQTRLMTSTAYDGIFEHCLKAWLEPAFLGLNRPGQDPLDATRLRMLGHATHVLADFFAHTNFIELLLTNLAARWPSLGSPPASPPALSPALCALIGKRPGAFGAYSPGLDPAQTPIMCGRFDGIDTAASLMKIRRHNLMRQWCFNDLEGLLTSADRNLKVTLQIGSRRFVAVAPSEDQYIFDVLLGTFSTNPYVFAGLQLVKAADTIKGAIGWLKDQVRGLAASCAGAALGKLFPNNGRLIGDVSAVMGAYKTEEMSRYKDAGELEYYGYLIEEHLRDELAQGKARLPHHTLLAKDNDVGQPECRLAYKLACILASEVTGQVLRLYFARRPIAEVDAVLDRYYQHPSGVLDIQGVPSHVADLVNQLYGERWWSLKPLAGGIVS